VSSGGRRSAAEDVSAGALREPAGAHARTGGCRRGGERRASQGPAGVPLRVRAPPLVQLCITDVNGWYAVR